MERRVCDLIDVTVTATDATLIALGLCTWLFYFFRYWRVANHVDRYEGIILRPLSVSVDLLALYYLLHKSWWAAAIAFWWGLFWIGGVAGATLRADRTARELANPPTAVAGGEILMLSDQDSWLIGRTVWKLSWLGFIPEMLLFLHHGLKWYVAVLASVAVSVAIGPVLAIFSFWTASLTLKKKQIRAS